MTTTLVRFDADGSSYALPVEVVRGVRAAGTLRPLPNPRPGVAGTTSGDPCLTVITPLGCGGGHVLTVEQAGRQFGLLVDRVTGLCQVADDEFDPPPAGQLEPLLSATVRRAEALIFVADAAALAGRL